ncbi:hypothetical protein ACERK3_00250 [Phycisphaerales bacterium AB-hyl4]|uniref:Superfamily III holin-X n=1 Tax=Natronomicrosphaera hydrolytica TaxID=3242702 RepID=A0ABV4U1R9_9BACT
MKAISEFIVRVMDLLEAEGRAAKRAIFRLFAALLVMVAVLALMLTAGAFFIVAIFLVLSELLTPAGTFAVMGAAMLLLAAGGALAAVQLRDKKASKP